MALTGTDAALLLGAEVTAEAGAVDILAPVEANLSYQTGATVIAETGALEIAGIDAALTRQMLVTAEMGALAITGTDAALLGTRLAAAEIGAVDIAGVDADLVYTIPAVLDAETGAVSITGVDAGLARQLLVAAELGTLAITGLDITALLAGKITAESGAVSILAPVQADLRLQGNESLFPARLEIDFRDLAYSVRSVESVVTVVQPTHTVTFAQGGPTMSVPARVNISRVWGDTYTLEIVIESEGDPVNVTGATFALVVDTVEDPTPPSATEEFTLTGVILEAANGRVGFTPSEVQAEQLARGTYYYDLKMTESGGAIRTLARGKWKVI